MKYILAVVNTELVENHLNKEFNSMDELMAWVESEEFEWTSLMITILPLRRG